MLTCGFDGATGVSVAAFAGTLANAVWSATLGRGRRLHRAWGAGMFGTLSRRLDRARRSGRTRFIRGFALAVLLSAAGVAIGSGIEAVTIPPVYAGLAAAATVALAVDHGAAFATGRTVLRLLPPPARDSDAAAPLLRPPPGEATPAARGPT